MRERTGVGRCGNFGRAKTEPPFKLRIFKWSSGCDDAFGRYSLYCATSFLCNMSTGAEGYLYVWWSGIQDANRTNSRPLSSPQSDHHEGIIACFHSPCSQERPGQPCLAIFLQTNAFCTVQLPVSTSQVASRCLPGTLHLRPIDLNPERRARSSQWSLLSCVEEP